MVALELGAQSETLHCKGKQILRTQRWFEHRGRWAPIVGPFIPAVRNLMGYAAGASKLRLPVFAKFAYLGALASSLSFISVGYLIGKHGG